MTNQNGAYIICNQKNMERELTSKRCQHCNRSTLINYNCLKSQITWQLSEIPNLVKELCKEPFFLTLSQTTNFR